jgi:hypothetical protein
MMALRFDPLPGRAWTFMVWCADSALWVARTTGSADAAADIKRFDKQEQAGEWLAGSADGVRPRKKVSQ